MNRWCALVDAVCRVSPLFGPSDVAHETADDDDDDARGKLLLWHFQVVAK